MTWRVLVHPRPSFRDHRGEGLMKEWRSAGLPGTPRIRVGQAYELGGAVPEQDARRLAEGLLTDPVTQEASLFPADHVAAPRGVRLAEVWPKRGVADPVGATVALAARDLGVETIAEVRSGHVYEFHGKVRAPDVRRFCEERLMNGLIHSLEVL